MVALLSAEIIEESAGVGIDVCTLTCLCSFEQYTV